MGYDLYGLNPKQNIQESQEYNDILKLYGKDGWIDWSKDIPEATKDRYFELKDQHQEDNPGEYFRNNVWWWRPLWNFVSYHCNDILTDKDIDGGCSNSGHKISKTKSLRIAKRLSKLLADGTVAHYDREYRLDYERANLHNKEVEEMLKDIKSRVKLKLGTKIPPVDYPEPFKSEWDKTYAKKDWTGNYPFDKENIENFATFCQESGGFEIC